jgi:hypothetical protein
LVGPGSAAAADGDRGLFAQRNSGDHIRVYLMQRVAQTWLADAGLSIGDTAGIRASLLAAYAGWGPLMRQFITDNDGPYVERPILMLPVGHSWEHSSSLTLLGDAAHLMPPVGIGVNLAMLDACELALALAGSASVGDAVRAYEKTMLPRAAELAEQAADGPEGLLGSDA